jgi:large subunit ribosomal protein L18
MISRIDKNSIRQKRHQRTRRHIIGTAERPRLNVYRSLNHIYAQVIDDDASNTLASASTLDAEVAAQLEGKTKSEAAEIVGETVAKRALEKGVKQVVFDRGGYLYTGRVQKLADGARKAGLEF